MFTLALLLSLCAVIRAIQPNDDIISVIRKVETRVEKVEGVVDVERKELVNVQKDVGDNKVAVNVMGNAVRNMTDTIAELLKKFGQEHKQWELQATNVCFGKKNNGSFQLQKQGFLTGIKLMHKAGYVTCKYYFTETQSNWGACTMDTEIGIYITDQHEQQIFPNYGKQINYRYHLAGSHSNKKELIFTDRSTPLYANEGLSLRVWHVADLNDDEYDTGRNCVDVYAMFE